MNRLINSEAFLKIKNATSSVECPLYLEGEDGGWGGGGNDIRLCKSLVEDSPRLQKDTYLIKKDTY